MKKIIFVVLILTIPTVLISCKEKKTDYSQYIDLQGKTEDASFSFTSDLPIGGKIYPTSEGRIFYISTMGDDNNDGLSVDTPFASVEKISRLTLIPGDKILFKSGDVFDGETLEIKNSGTDDNPIYYGVYGEGDKPIIKTKLKRTVYLEDVSNVVIEGLELFMEARDRTVDGGSFPSVVQTQFICKEKKYKNIYILNNKVHSSGYKSRSNGISFGSVFEYGASGEEIIHDYATNIYVMHNEIFNVGNIGLHIQSWLSDLSMVGADHKIYRNVRFDSNTIYSIGQIGAYINSVTNGTLNRNTVHTTGINTMGLESAGETGLMTIGAASSEIKFNEVYLNESAGMSYDGMGIDIDWNCIDITVQYNNCYSNDGAGIATMANLNSFILNNRIANNKANGNQWGQIQITDFTARYKAVDEKYYTTQNMLVKDNLIINNQENKYAVSIRSLNGDPQWEGNKFIDNHIVNNFIGNKPKYIYVEEITPWYQFGSNKYYGNVTTHFGVLDETPQGKMNSGAVAIPNKVSFSFDDWKKRDIGATLELLSSRAPSKVSDVKATFNKGELKLIWKKSKGDIWHYNVHMVAFDEKTDYTNMLGETQATEFNYEFKNKGTYYIIIQPESNQGIWGEAVKVKIELK